MANLVGMPAPAFELSDPRGTVYRLEDFRGNWLLLDFHRHLG